MADCYLQNEQYVLEGDVAALGPLEPKGSIATMLWLDGVWKVEIIASEAGACL